MFAKNVQPYSFVVNYKKGSELYVADALSRAYVEETKTCESLEKEMMLICVL